MSKNTMERTSNDDPDLVGCQRPETPCKKLTLDEDISKEELERLYNKCCKNKKCTEKKLSTSKNLIVTLYVKNTKLRPGGKAKNCEGNVGSDCKEIRDQNKFKNLELVIDLVAPPENDEDKQKAGDKFKSGCQDDTPPVGKPKTGRNNKPVQKPGNFPLRISLPNLPTIGKVTKKSNADWLRDDPILGEGEVAINLNGEQKVGDGKTPWSELPFVPENENLTGCPLVYPILNIQIPKQENCLPEETETAFNNFEKVCGGLNDPRNTLIIPQVCGGDSGTKCNWTHLYLDPVPPEARGYYEADGTLKDAFMPRGLGGINNGYRCQDRSKALQQDPPVDLDGKEIFDKECTDAFGYTPPGVGTDGLNMNRPKSYAGGVDCPSSSMKNLCGTLTCLDNSEGDDKFIGRDEDGETFPVTASDISVSIVNKDGDIASGCLGGESHKAFTFVSDSSGTNSDDPDTINIDIHMGSECDEDNTDESYEGISVCVSKETNCDTPKVNCITATWQGTPPGTTADCGNPNYKLLQSFECLDANSDKVKDLLNSDACNASPLVYCCRTISAIAPRKLETKSMEECCSNDNDNQFVVGLLNDTSEDLAKRICNPKVACCMNPPSTPEGTCVYSKPEKVVNKFEVKYYFSGKLIYFDLGKSTQLNRTFPTIEPFDPDKEYVQMVSAIRNLGLVNYLHNTEYEFGYRTSKNTAATNIKNWGLSDFGAVWNTTIKSAAEKGFFNKKLKIVDYNFETIKTYDVEDCEDSTINTIVNNPENDVKYTDIGELSKQNKTAFPDLPSINNFNDNISFLEQLGVPTGTYTANPTEFTHNKITTKKLSCVGTNWTLETIRASTQQSCDDITRKIRTCCNGSATFIPNLVNNDLSTNPAEINCSVDAKTGALTCENLPSENDNPCFIVSDSQYYSAIYECTERKNGRAIAIEGATVTLGSSCPDTVDCNNNPPDEPPPQPDPEDPDNPLDPPSTPDDPPDPPAEPPPPPKNDDPPPPPKREPPNPPNVVNCNNKINELERAEKVRNALYEELKKLDDILYEARQSNKRAINEWNRIEASGCRSIIISLFQTLDITRGVVYYTDPKWWAKITNREDCARLISNVAITWSGEDRLPEDIAPYITTANPVLEKQVKRSKYCVEQLKILDDRIVALTNDINNNCPGALD